eukprot:3840608-Prorocentrum_lima.AAC.1
MPRHLSDHFPVSLSRLPKRRSNAIPHNLLTSEQWETRIAESCPDVLNEDLTPYERYILFTETAHLIAHEARQEIQEQQMELPQQRLLALRDALVAHFTNRTSRRDKICRLLQIPPTTEAITHLISTTQ